MQECLCSAHTMSSDTNLLRSNAEGKQTSTGGIALRFCAECQPANPPLTLQHLTHITLIQIYKAPLSLLACPVGIHPPMHKCLHSTHSTTLTQ